MRGIDKRNQGIKKDRLKPIAAIVCIILTLAITYIPFLPDWDDIYVAVGLRSEYREKLDFDPQPLTVSFIDVGQGDSIFIWTKDKCALIDTGPAGSGRKIVNYIRQFGISKLDYLIITHPHDDHMGALSEIEKQIDIDTELTALTMLELSEGITLTCLGPLYESDNENNMSLVMMLNYGDNRILLMGDAEEEEELSLLRTYQDLHADVIKVGHHGSSSSTTPELLRAVQPMYAVISVGAGNDYGHPNARTLETLQNIPTYRTDLQGTIAVTSDGKTLTFHTYRQKTGIF